MSNLNEIYATKRISCNIRIGRITLLTLNCVSIMLLQLCGNIFLDGYFLQILSIRPHRLKAAPFPILPQSYVPDYTSIP